MVVGLVVSSRRQLVLAASCSEVTWLHTDIQPKETEGVERRGEWTKARPDRHGWRCCCCCIGTGTGKGDETRGVGWYSAGTGALTGAENQLRLTSDAAAETQTPLVCVLFRPCSCLVRMQQRSLSFGSIDVLPALLFN